MADHSSPNRSERDEEATPSEDATRRVLDATLRLRLGLLRDARKSLTEAVQTSAEVRSRLEAATKRP